MKQVKISIAFPEGVDFEALPTIDTSSITGTPMVGDVLVYGNKAKFIVEGRAWEMTEEGTELHINLKEFSLRN